MPIAQNEQLFKLIKSLQKAEKRHFKLFLNKLESEKSPLLLRLFDFLDLSRSLDEKKLTKKFADLKSSDFINIKRNLYGLILKSLRQLHSRHDLDIKIREQIDYAKILYGKGLYLQSLKILDRVVPLAVESRQEIILLEILEFEKLIESRHITRSRNVKNKVENLISLSNKYHTSIARTSGISNLSLMTQGLYIKMGIVKNDKEHFLVESYFKSNLPRVLSKNPGFYEEVLLHQSYVWYHYMLLNNEESLSHAIQWVDVFDRNPEMQMMDPDLYMRGMHYVLTNNFYLKNKDDFKGWLSRFKKFNESNQHKFNETSKLLCFTYGSNAKINELLLLERYDQTSRLEKEIFEEIKKFELQIDSHRVMMIHYKFAWLKIAIGKYQEAIDHLNFIIQRKKGQLRKDLICFAKLLNLIANFHLKNFALVNNLAPGVRRAFDLENEMNSAISLIITMLNKTPSDNNYVTTIDKLLIKMEKTLTDKYSKRIFNYFDFHLWSRSLKEKSTMAEIYPT